MHGDRDSVGVLCQVDSGHVGGQNADIRLHSGAVGRSDMGNGVARAEIGPRLRALRLLAVEAGIKVHLTIPELAF